MSLEQAIAKNTETLESLAAAIADNTAMLNGLTSKARAAAGTDKDSEKGEEDKGTKPARRTRQTKPKAPTVNEIKKAAEEFLNAEDEDTYNKRRDIVKGIAKKFDAPKLTEIAEEHRAEAIALLKAAEEDDGEDDANGDDDLV